MHEITGQVHWHEPSGCKRAGFGKFDRPKTPYDLFMESEGIPIFRDIGVSKVQNLPLAPVEAHGRPRHLHPAPRHRGQMGLLRRRGAGCRRAQSRKASLRGDLSTSSKAAARPRSGSTGDSKRHVFEWQKGSLFSIPVNAMAPHRQRQLEPRHCCSPARPRPI